MKLFCKEEMKRLELAAERAGVGLDELMENAGKALANEMEKRLESVKSRQVVLLCGNGNNGGDGFVCARLLSEKGADCAVLLAQGEPKTELARAALQKLPGEVNVIDAGEAWEAAQLAIERAEVLVDCVFGFGFAGELSGLPLKLLSLANRREGCLKLSADLPSGAECDTGRASKGAFRADVTVTFTGKKPASCSYPAKELCGETVVRQVGVPAPLLGSAETRINETDVELACACLREPDAQANKGDMGRLLLVCGSYGMVGACILAVRAALRCGVGLAEIALEKEIYPIVARAVPEAVFLPLDWENEPTESEEKLRKALDRCTACLVGCGLGELSETVCPIVLENRRVPLLLDADGLNFCARHPGLLGKLTVPFVLTPHPGEMSRLCGKSIPEIQADRLETAQAFSRRVGGVVVLKGAGTVIAGEGGRCMVNPTGNPGMAKGGSGDVLAGMTASLLAQGVPCFEAAAAGAYFHGLAGDLCAQRMGKRAMLPSDIINALPEIWGTFPPEIELSVLQK